jgi:transposase
VIELSIRRRDRRRIIGEWALHRYDGIFGTDRSNGQVEGQINRLKMVKRQMFGRANLDLLKARVLQAA